MPAAIPPVDQRRLEGHVRKLCEEFFPRDAFHPENLDRAAAYVRSQFEETGARVADQPFVVEGHTYRNVVASFGPETREHVVVGAHYDACGELPGADDNASGVAGLIELAGLLAGAPLSSRVDLVAFTLEEPPSFGSPAMGSAVHAKSLREAGARVRAMLALEMIGCFSDEPGSQQFPLPLLRLFYPGRGNFLALAGRLVEIGLLRRVRASMRAASPLPVRSIAAPRGLFGIDLSDNVSYWDQGYPALMVTDTAFFRNERYHTAEDTPDTLDYPRMAEVVPGLFRAVVDLAGEPLDGPPA
jgi:Zn-dependent M28 family amino/carboxypeptidase